MINLLNDSTENSNLKVGDKAPDFVLSTEEGKKWRLSEQLGKVTALLFYPKNETLICTRQMCAVRDNWTDYLETKASVVGISSGTTEEHQDFSQRYRLPLPILADANREITKIYSQHWLMPVQFMRAIVVVDARGFICCRRVMLRVFRPTDKSVIASIYAARTDSLQAHFSNILSEAREKTRQLH